MGDGDTELWLVDLETAAVALDATEAATPRLSDDIRQRADAMRDADARRDRRLAHVALRILLERQLGPAVRGVPFVLGPAGKPVLEASTGRQPLSFSLAHTRGLALIAIGGSGPLGVDIERDRAVRIPVARRVPIEAEAVTLAGGTALAGPDGSDARFLHAWVRIEAVAKATGRGVGPLLERLRPARAGGTVHDVAAPTQGAPRTREPEPLSAPLLQAYDVPLSSGLYAAIAFPPGPPPPPCRAFPASGPGIDALLGEDRKKR